MREPQVQSTSGSTIFVPLSQASLWSLLIIVNGNASYIPDEDGTITTDRDFDRQYAAIILKERGA